MARRVSDPWTRLRRLAALGALIFCLGVGGYMVIEDWNFLEALYMTVITLATVGYGEVQRLDGAGRVLTIGLIFAGVAWVGVTLAMFTQAVQEGALGERGRKRRMQKRISEMRDHYIVCGFGRVGRVIVKDMNEENVPFVVIDRNPGLEETLIELGLAYVIGNPANDEALKQTGVERARCLVSAVDDDADNAYITLTARSLNSEIFIVARAANEATQQHLYRAGADRVVLPALTGGHDMAHQALHRRVIDTLDFKRPGLPPLFVEEILIEDQSDLADKELRAAVGAATALAITRDSEVITHPDPDLRLRSGDRVLLLGDRESLRPLEGD